MLIGEDAGASAGVPAQVPQAPARRPATPGIFVPAELTQMVTDLSATVREQQRLIGSLVDKWVNDKGGDGK